MPFRLSLMATIMILGVADPGAAQSTLHPHLDPSRLTSGRDSFVVMLQGKPSGWQILARARDGSGWQLSDAISIGAMVSQGSVMRFDAGLAEYSLRQSGTMQGRNMEIALDWADGRVRGKAITPTHPAGPLVIDTLAAAGTVEDNAVLGLLAAVVWHDSLAITTPVLASGKGTLDPWTLQVLGAEAVTVPAGLFDTWRVEMKSSGTRTYVNITRAAPYRIVRISMGAAFEIQLVP